MVTLRPYGAFRAVALHAAVPRPRVEDKARSPVHTGRVTALPHEPMTVEEFLAWDPGEDDENEYEFADGRIVVMANGSPRHDDLATAVAAVLYAGLHHGPCRVVALHRALRIGTRVRKPDVMVVCTPAAEPGHEVDADYLVEVLSPSTASVDITDKLLEYGTLPSIKQYLVLSPDARVVYLFTRHDLGWHAELVDDDTVEFAATRLDLGAIYARLDRQNPLETP